MTGNPLLKSQGEIDGEKMTMSEVAMMTLVRPFILGFTEPIVASWNAYLALIYGMLRVPRSHRRVSDFIGAGILYCFISSFDIVFMEKHGFNLGQNGLAFLVSSLKNVCQFCFGLMNYISQGIITGVVITYFCFLPWAIFVLKPKFKNGSKYQMLYDLNSGSHNISFRT